MSDETGDQPHRLEPDHVDDVLSRLRGAGPGEHRIRHGARGGAWWITGRTLIAVLSVALLLAIGVGWVIKHRADAEVAKRYVPPPPTTDTNIVAPSSAVLTVSTNGTTMTTTVAPSYAAVNILLLGTDSRDGGSNGSSGGGGDDGSANSDTLMIAHLSADRSHVTVLSIPRDTQVPAPQCDDWDYRTGDILGPHHIDPGDVWSINAAYAVGGSTCTVLAVQKFTGIRIDRVIGIDFSGFKAMVDALHGITLDICRPIVDAELGTIVPQAGVQTLQGEQALTLVRARNVKGDTESDLARIHRQQVVLSTILRQVTTAGTLLNPAKLDAFLQAFAKNTFTSEGTTIDDLVSLASSLGDFSPGKVTFYTLPTVPSTSNPDKLDPDTTKDRSIFDALINDRTLPGQTAAATTPATPTTGSVRPPSTRTTSTARTTRSTASAASSGVLNTSDLPGVNAGDPNCV